MSETWVERLIEEYGAGKAKLEAYRDKLSKEEDWQRVEASLVGGMVADMEYSLSWIRRRYADKSLPSRPTRLNRRMFPSLEIMPERRLTEEQKQKLVDIICALSDREQQCLLLHTAYGLSLGAIGKELGISKAAVQTLVRRAQKKISNF